MTAVNIKPMKLSFAMAMLLPTSLIMGESSTSDPIILEDTTVYSQVPEAKNYKYGMRLDIAKVVTMEYFPPEPNFCGVIPAQMTYEDSMGKIHAIRYLYPEISGCPDN
ncbi:DUF2790 domain-containing protein [Azomonas macrocytogenes]|uniref:DUF2790 domain-containing protein n=1 Tax=Azomonas macrocytogenes TaxID=69962 RepID=A0A839T3H3_AZOMA|nr:DUF2790 domain-containing protein [Azomonas macrocytogenes]MBB3103559.1 hypothetical protein [Azomonas macrocytogenes]